MNKLLSAHQLSFSYNSAPVLERIDFTVSIQDTVALVGANGAGKTTLLKLCAGILSPQHGEVLLQDKPLHRYKGRELARRIALVPQELHISFDFTVRQLVEQGRTPYLSFFGGLGRRDHRSVQQAMEAANVAYLADRNFNQLSGGERQRVKIALALAQEPQLLLLDEPAQHLDIGRQAEIFSVLRGLNESGITIIAAVHDLQSARKHFSSAILLLPGSAAVCGDPEVIFTPEAIQRGFGLAGPAYELPHRFQA